jgi:hypothetical protein
VSIWEECISDQPRVALLADTPSHAALLADTPSHAALLADTPSHAALLADTQPQATLRVVAHRGVQMNI